ncbi:DnaJ-domain-containing protein [Coccomyxa subellipsoidea C-169]|uniref:DnaJ-domain-containing protein n=1 Tax=Coccomyxa subellipsoidea (strain C-169) TaxID=574566 RepID=I0ZAT3_COCSC|nr:DnaJ-domain-containing protein [Coccomyxa subellipsoidea C-169]EIE27752.1 DnaJ-domain-containing protein [Coccomyxa subellipsoidea C-169]|eukprot:XP_005652296.1 DnaJ-domain-containing protein [Coccomyxa subellipsoidea C-169]
MGHAVKCVSLLTFAPLLGQVVKITRTKDYYQILSIERSATDDEIKRSYRKLALKLHPDKCAVPGADEAFKAVSRAFSCLSDAQKRAAYDRYGEETPGMSGRANGAGPGHPFAQQEFDPEELFNMFFNGGFGGTRGPVFRTHFGGVPPGAWRQAPRQPQGPQQPVNPVTQLLHFLPVVLLLLFTFLQMPGQPEYNLDKVAEYRSQVETARLGVPFFVKDAAAFQRSHPKGGRERARVENEVEALFKERLEQQCYAERVNQQRLYRWGQVERAKAFPLPHCEELKATFGSTRMYT